MLTLLGAALLPFIPVTAMADDLHPLGKPLPDGAIRFELRDFVPSGQPVAVEAVYQPYRERDVRRESHLHLFDSVWRSGSRETLSVNREDLHTVMQTARATGSSLNFTLPLHATDEGYGAYQLARVRVNQLTFATWFDGPPKLSPEFGLHCSAAGLQGKARLTGISAAPLNGSLPLWPALRSVQLSVDSVSPPSASLWDAHTKHYWDGWRNAIPQEWPGGETIVSRHIDGAAVWRAHSYFAYGAAGTPLPPRPAPPAGVLPGTRLEIFWPTGDKLEFPDANFAEPASVVALRVAGLPQRAQEILARSVEVRPGVELYAITAAEWAELEGFAEEKIAPPVAFEIEGSSGDHDLLVAYRRNLAEPWLYLFGIPYDADRLVSLSVLRLDPQPWSGPLPE